MGVFEKGECEKMEHAMVIFENVSKKLGNFTLKDITFTLPKGYIMGVIGPNGAGKTSLLHLLLGLYKPMEGTIQVDDKEYALEEAEILSEIGVVLLDELYDGSRTLLQNGREYGRFYRNYNEVLFREYLARFGLEEQRKYKKLSAGEKLKFQFAFALSHNAKLLVLDEPTGNFDPGFRKEFFQILRKFIADGSRSVVLSSHPTEDLDRMADYILYLEKGEVVFAGDIEKLREKYRLLTGENYKIKLVHKEQVIHVEEGTYSTRALVKHWPGYEYDSALTVTVPTLEELMYFMTKRRSK